MIGRVQDRRTFQRFRSDARRTRSGELWCAALPDEAVQPARIAFAIGKTVGTAVVRNRLRRRLREIASAHHEVLAPGSYLIGVRPGAVNCSYEELTTMFLTLFDQPMSERR